MAECKRQRIPIPPPYDNPPQYSSLLFGIFIEAFNTLSSERPLSDKAVHYIARRAIREWAEDNNLAHDPDFMEELFAYTAAMDKVWVAIELKRRRTKAKVKTDGNS